jgi:hypothetical protein
MHRRNFLAALGAIAASPVAFAELSPPLVMEKVRTLGLDPIMAYIANHRSAMFKEFCRRNEEALWSPPEKSIPIPYAMTSCSPQMTTNWICHAQT